MDIWSQHWPLKHPDSYLDYSFDATAPLGPADALAEVSVSLMPSGAGEMTASSLSIAGSMITLWFAGGVGGRRHTVRIDATCASGRVFEWLVGITVDPAFQPWPPLDPPSAAFGAPLTWTLPTSVQAGALLGIAAVASAASGTLAAN